jgi:pseudouridine-5'-phosphate glycosidase
MATLALESTVIAHGLPYPQNLSTARELEAIVRAHRVEPKTIAILDGQIKIGLSPQELEYLAAPRAVLKVSRRDLAFALATKRTGATTVSATMYLAHRAGIRVFATGGIGGVHRRRSSSEGGDEDDVSADLYELAQTPVAVVCAGAKAILDLPRTLEWLETFGVPVLGYQTDEFPAFYSRTSGRRASARVDSVDQAARVIYRHWELGLRSGVLVCAPIPEQDEIPRAQIEPMIERALGEADKQNVKGAAITPFVLARLAELTHGASVRANIALLRNNVAVASDIARRLELLMQPLA